jgi:hypothetical protein
MLRWLVAVAVSCAPALAFADRPALDPYDPMARYFAGEKIGGYVLMGMGTVGLVTGAYLITRSNLTMKGASYPALGIGVLHLAAGIYINLASAKRVDEFSEQIGRDPEAFVERESKRMRAVSTQFTVLKIVECVLIAGGVTTFVVARKRDRPRLAGAGLAVAIEMGATLAFDFTAAARASEYRERLAEVADDQAGVDTPSPGTVMLVHTGVF